MYVDKYVSPQTLKAGGQEDDTQAACRSKSARRPLDAAGRRLRFRSSELKGGFESGFGLPLYRVVSGFIQELGLGLWGSGVIGGFLHEEADGFRNSGFRGSEFRCRP